MRDSWATQSGELLRIQEAVRDGVPFVLYRDADDALGVRRLGADITRVSIGRGDGCDLCIAWDERVSRTHCVIERVGDEWLVVDGGMSRNGTFVNSERVGAQRRLSDHDVLRVGRTTLLFRVPTRATGAATVGPSHMPEPGELTVSQRRVLEALARPCVVARGLAAPATNERIAGELHLSVEAVKAHLRMLFRRFGIEELPQVQKRIRLVQLAMDGGYLDGLAARGSERPVP